MKATKKCILFFVCFVLCALASGCSFFERFTGGDSQSESKKTLAAPDCKILDDLVYWEEVENAAGYVAEVDGAELPVQTENYLTLPRTRDVSVRVKAVPAEDDTTKKESKFGFALTRQADPSEYTVLTKENLTVDCTLTDEAYDVQYAGFSYAQITITVKPTVKLIKISTKDCNMCAKWVISPREDPIIFELNGAEIYAASGTCLSVQRENGQVKGCPDLIIRSAGETDNYIGGGNGKRGQDGKNSSGRETGGVGGHSGSGYSGIYATQVFISGTRSLAVSGGDGQQGGRGGDSMLGSGGRGGDGGDGGNGITATTVYVHLAYGATLETSGGYRGSGGNGGEGFGRVKGPNGTAGKSGVGITCTPTEI